MTAEACCSEIGKVLLSHLPDVCRLTFEKRLALLREGANRIEAGLRRAWGASAGTISRVRSAHGCGTSLP